ncbi:MAG: 10 kDa chaperonin [Chlamydiae bacterium]|nr:10 kDa chaperonin [Chlamydiota bacterium]
MTVKKSVKIKPLLNRVLVQRLEADNTVSGGIILPDSAKKQQESAKVIAVGPGQKDSDGKLVPMPVKEGDVVLMDKYAGQEIELDGEQYHILRSDDLIAIIVE